MKTTRTHVTPLALLGALALLLVPSAYAADPVVLEPGPGDVWDIHHSEIAVTSDVTTEGLEIAYEIVPPPGVNYIAAAHPWQWEAPKDGKIEVELRAAQQRGCYLLLRLDGADGRQFSALFSGDPKTGYLMTKEGSTAELFLADFKTGAGEELKAGDLIEKVVLVIAPDASNTVTLNKITLLPEND